MSPRSETRWRCKGGDVSQKQPYGGEEFLKELWVVQSSWSSKIDPF